MSGGACRRTLTLPCLLLVAAVVLCPQRGVAQALYGSIVGDVKDSSGAVMPGATVVATNKSTGLIREAVTDEGGRYQLANLPAGVYSFKATQQGFKAFEQTELTVSLNSVTRLDVSLEIGAMGDNVTVSAEAPVLQTDTAEVHQSLEAKDLSNLPVPLGRNYQQVYRMLPGFAPPTNSHSIPTNPARSLEFSVNGTSDDQNNTRIDGVSTTHVQLPHVVSYIPTLESIQEVNVVTNSMDAEQGLAGGAAVNVATKSGTNSIQGSAFEYFTNQNLKAWPMRFDDAALNTGDKPKMSLRRVWRHRRRPDQEEQDLLLRQLRVDPRPQDRRQHRDGAASGDAQRRPAGLSDANLRSADRECRRHRSHAVPGVPRRSELRVV